MRKLLISFLALAVLLSVSLETFAKRQVPKPVEPIIHKEIEYRAPHHLMGCIEAWHRPSGIRIWWRQIYVVKYNPKKETDVQDVHIIKMEMKDDNLIIKNEMRRKYSLNLSSLKVKRALL